MDTNRWQTIEGVFHDALGLEGDARSRFIEQKCSGDAALLDEVRAMLSVLDDDARLMIEERLNSSRAPESPPCEGQIVGSYRLVRLLGEGGIEAPRR